MKYSTINSIIIIVLTLIHLSEQGKRCVCHQCAHIRYEGRRCECCVYMLQGKKRSMETTFPIVSDNYDNSKYDNTQYDNTQYDNTRYDNTLYDNTKHDYAQVDDTREDIDEDYSTVGHVNNEANSNWEFYSPVKDIANLEVNNVNEGRLEKNDNGNTIRQHLLIDYLTQINKLAAQRQTMNGYLNKIFDS